MKESNMGRFFNFLWFFSGAKIDFLQKCTTDHNKYKSLGAAILFTGIFACLSAIFAMRYFTDSLLASISIGLLWGITIINIDMLIVNTILKYEKRTWKNSIALISRIILAAFIALSISIPLELTILNDEIIDEIDNFDQAAQDLKRKTIEDSFQGITILKEEKIKRTNEFNQEMQGAGSGRVGYGVIAQKIEQQMNDLDAEIATAEHQKKQEIATLDKDIQARRAENNPHGFLASYRALHRLKYDSIDYSVLLLALGLKILLLLIECLPIISKGFMPRGAYDAYFENEESQLVVTYDDLREETIFISAKNKASINENKIALQAGL